MTTTEDNSLEAIIQRRIEELKSERQKAEASPMTLAANLVATKELEAVQKKLCDIIDMMENSLNMDIQIYSQSQEQATTTVGWYHKGRKDNAEEFMDFLKKKEKEQAKK